MSCTVDNGRQELSRRQCLEILAAGFFGLLNRRSSGVQEMGDGTLHVKVQGLTKTLQDSTRRNRKGNYTGQSGYEVTVDKDPGLLSGSKGLIFQEKLDAMLQSW